MRLLMKMLRHTCFATLFVVAFGGCAVRPTLSAPLRVTVLAINDFHGNLRPPQGGIRIYDPTDSTKRVQIPAGGAPELATAVAQLEARNPNHVFVAAGDLIGASPLLSSLFHDEPTIEAFNMMGLDISAVGNHEFDKGVRELRRIQNGGCHPTDGCRGPQPFAGARFSYLAANTIDNQTGRPIMPSYEVKTFEGIPVAFIGLTLEDTPSVVMSSAIRGLTFRDEAETVNALVPELQRQGIETIVVLIHEGGMPGGDYNACGVRGPIVDIVERFDKAVDVVVSGHTHRAYNCRIGGMLLTSADRFGTVLTDIELQIDRRTHDVITSHATNVIVRTNTFAADTSQLALIAYYDSLSAPLMRRAIGPIAETIEKGANPAGESPLGQVIADAQLEATQRPEDGGAQIAFTNSGGIRAPLVKAEDGIVRYQDVFTVHPFGNTLVTMTLTGAQLLTLLEQQWHTDGSRTILQISRGSGYTFDTSRPVGQRVVPASVHIGGMPLNVAASYRVTVNNFLADGGDGLPLFKEGTDRRNGISDVDALERYVKAHPGLKAGTVDRIVRRN